MQIDVETKEIEVLRAQKFGRWKIAERAKAIRVDHLGRHREFVDELRHTVRSAPAHHVRRDFVHHADGKQGRVPFAGSRGFADGGERLVATRFGIEEARTAIPGHIHQHEQVVLGREVQEPPGRRMVHAQHVGLHLADQFKIFGGLLGSGETRAQGIRRERPVGDPFGVELLGAKSEKLAIHHHAVR